MNDYALLAALNLSWELDGWIIVVAMLCASSCALLGNFLVLRRMSMLGDAISHAVLPGLAVAFFISNSRSSLPMFLGAVLVGILTAFFAEWIRRVGRVDEGASMGVVFTSLFALGLVLIVQAADRVDLDANCVLYGAIEVTPLDTVEVFGRHWPRAAVVLTPVAIINFLFVTLLFKELKISSFDPALATTAGFNATLLHYLLMILVAVTAVASFESVGSVLVVAMFVVPPATAYLLTDRLAWMIPLSLIVACFSAVSGHISAIVVPNWFGYQSTTTASMMAVCSGLFLALAVLFAPRQGVVIKYLWQRILSAQILAEDIVALLYRFEENERQSPVTKAEIIQLLMCDRWSFGSALRRLTSRKEIATDGETVHLTEAGRKRAQNLVRSHRLWETYLMDHVGTSPQRVHQPAEKLEHFTDSQLRQQLERETNASGLDPHGSQIPGEIPEDH